MNLLYPLRNFENQMILAQFRQPKITFATTTDNTKNRLIPNPLEICNTQNQYAPNTQC